jgi:hypothetical protein
MKSRTSNAARRILVLTVTLVALLVAVPVASAKPVKPGPATSGPAKAASVSAGSWWVGVVGAAGLGLVVLGAGLRVGLGGRAATDAPATRVGKALPAEL